MKRPTISLLTAIVITAGMAGVAGMPTHTATALAIGQPAIAITPIAKDFGTVTVGKTKTVKFKVANTGTSRLRVGAVVIDGTNESEFSTLSDSCSGKSIKPSKTCLVSVAFAPTSTGTKSGQLQLPSNDPVTPTLKVDLTGRSTTAITVTPTSKDFGTVTVGQTATARFRISNTGTSLLSIDALTIEGSDETEFSTEADSCSGRSFKSSRGCSVKVAFAPTSAGPKTAQLEIASNAPAMSPLDLALTGTGASAACTAYLQNGGSVTLQNQSYCATATDESPVKVVNAGSFTLSESTITSSGNTSSPDDSSFYGLNAGVLATTAGTIHLADSAVNTTGTGANGVFATGSGSSITLERVTINCTGRLGHGVDATNEGTLTLTDVAITTSGANGAAIATDRGGGTISVTGGTMATSGADSPGIYSTGAITVAGAAISATGSEGAVIEGANSITLTNTTLSGAKKRGVMIYQSMSGDAQGKQGTFTMTGGSLSAAVGPLFYVTNSTGIITLTGVTATAASGTLVNAAAGNWGTAGSNGGTAFFTADSQTLVGDLTTDSISSITAVLQNHSTLTGYINSAALSLDATSSWTVTEDSHLTGLTDAAEIADDTIPNITGNGFTVTYKASLAANGWLGGKTYSLNGGGFLTPQ